MATPANDGPMMVVSGTRAGPVAQLSLQTCCPCSPGGSGVGGVDHEDLTTLREVDADTLVLGCTHYPLLSGVIQWVMGDDVVLVSSAEETAKDVYKALAAHELLRDPSLGEPNHRFLATGDPHSFATMGRRFLGPEVRDVHSAVEVVS